MADLLIKGLEMPKGDLALWIFVHKDGTVEYIDNNKYEGYKTLRNAAVTVPPHGRLGDLDRLGRIVCEGLAPSERDGGFKTPFDIVRAIANAPTIVPESEVENGKV